MRNNQGIVTGGLLILLLGAFLASLVIGDANVPLSDVLKLMTGTESDGVAKTIVMDFRLPRALIAVLVGATLAAAGSSLQGLTGNPLADPYLLGVASGASLGAAIAVATPGLSAMIPLCATVGALISLMVVFAITGRDPRAHPGRFLLGGVIVGSFLAAAGQLLLALTGTSQDRIVAWILGDLGSATLTQARWAAPIIGVGIAVLWWFGPQVDAIAFGPALARTVGVKLEVLPIILLSIVGVLTAIAVSISGIIGFIGFVTPHIARAMVGCVQRRVLITAALCGGLLLLVADVLSRTLRPGMPIPIGVITALLGAPALAVVLRKAL
ncbi:MAG: FecCD family ABC transporter permease [Armatimonadota bacterium]